MSSWKGWSEHEVRQKRNPAESMTCEPATTASVPAMAGFTAINAPEVGYKEASGTSQPPEGAKVSSVPSTVDQRKSVASEYLGRGDAESGTLRLIQDVGPLHGPGSKKAGAKSKKRASSLASHANSKRRKISDVAETMGITKATGQASQTCRVTPSTDVDTIQSSPTITAQKSRERAKPKRSPKARSEDPTMSNAMQSVSVIAPSTSMDAVSRTPQQTSLEAVRANKGYGAVLYNGALPPSNIQANVTTFEPLMNSTTQVDRPEATANTRVLRPRKAKAVADARSTAAPETDSVNSPGAQPPKRRLAERPLPSGQSSVLDEDFLDEDDDLAEALALANTIETNFRPTAEAKATFSNKTQLPTPVNSDTLTDSDNYQKPRKRRPTPILNPDEELVELSDEDEAEIVDLREATENDATRRSPTPPARERKRNMREVDAQEDYGGALLSEAERQLLDKLKAVSDDSVQPIVRKPFPIPVLDRSPIFGASNNTVLRTSFRLGEALNVGSQAVRANKSVILEIYARVTSSWREPKPGRKQYFVFNDLYHDRPPHLEGSFELWDQGRLWDLDGKAFLQSRDGGVMCRVIGKMKREGTQWKLEILSIWEASWEDVDCVAGIYARDADSSGD